MIRNCEGGSQVCERDCPLLLHRLIPCSRSQIYGIPQTINSANYVYFLAYKELFALREEGPDIVNKDQQLDRLVTGMLDTLDYSTCSLDFLIR